MTGNALKLTWPSPDVFVGMLFGEEVSIMKIILHSRPSGLRASRWAGNIIFY
jgi:hypothetical protein